MVKYFLLFFLFGCAGAPEKVEQTPETAVPVVGSVNPAKLAYDEADTRFHAFLKSYTTGNTAECADFFDQSMIGRQELIETLNNSKTTQKRISIFEKSSKTEILGDNTAVIHLDWEKLFINLAGGEEKSAGKTIFFMQKKVENQWKLVGQTGDNIFLP